MGDTKQPTKHVSQHPISAKEKAEIIRLYDSGMNRNQLAKMFNRTRHSIYELVDYHRMEVAAARRAQEQFFAELQPMKIRNPVLIGAERALQDKSESGATRSLTATLMGDPPPHRSALGRECRPDEYASRGEGRWRDPFIRGAGNLTGRNIAAHGGKEG